MVWAVFIISGILFTFFLGRLRSPLLAPEDIVEPVLLLRGLQDGRGDLHGHIWGHIPYDQQQRVARIENEPEDLRKLLTDVLNNLIQGPSLYDTRFKVLFQSINIRNIEIRELVRKRPTGTLLMSLNRLVLESTYGNIAPHETPVGPVWHGFFVICGVLYFGTGAWFLHAVAPWVGRLWVSSMLGLMAYGLIVALQVRFHAELQAQMRKARCLLALRKALFASVLLVACLAVGFSGRAIQLIIREQAASERQERAKIARIVSELDLNGSLPSVLSQEPISLRPPTAKRGDWLVVDEDTFDISLEYQYVKIHKRPPKTEDVEWVAVIGNARRKSAGHFKHVGQMGPGVEKFISEYTIYLVEWQSQRLVYRETLTSPVDPGGIGFWGTWEENQEKPRPTILEWLIERGVVDENDVQYGRASGS